jgi:type II secretory pathway component HofQ
MIGPPARFDGEVAGPGRGPLSGSAVFGSPAAWPNRDGSPRPIEAIPILPTEEGRPQAKRLVYALKNVPAQDLAATLTQALRAQPIRAGKGDTMVIAPDVVSNSLVIGGPQEAIEEVERLIQALDRPAAMIQFEIVIGETLAAPAKVLVTAPDSAEEPAKSEKKTAEAGKLRPIEKPGDLRVVSRASLTTLDNQEAYVQIGRRQPRITGVSLSSFGQSNSVSDVLTGSLIRLTPRVTPGGDIVTAVDVEHSQMDSADEGAPITVTKQGETILAQSVTTMTVRTSVRLADGQTTYFAGQAPTTRNGRERQLVISITPKVRRVGESKR